ncbi:putative phage repressor [Cereibacter sphaeroides WS8N]|nr:putative phage repressor [Cereibacter sphaeroides WS8N]
MSTFGERLREERERLRLSQIDFAALGGAKKHSQINYEADRTAPDTDYLTALGKHGVDIVYVLTGERSGTAFGLAQKVHERYADVIAFSQQVASRTEAALAAIPDEDYVPVPVHSALLAAGDGCDNAGDDVVDHLAFRRDWLRRIGVSLTAAALARAKGDSMSPSIHDGDMLLIDTAQDDAPFKVREPADTRPAMIYALRDDLGARVKRIERIAPGRIMLLSDNPAFAPEVKSDGDVTILGRVVWWGHTNRE